MITFYQLEKRINDLTHSIVPQDVHFTTIHNARLEVLKWAKNENEIRPESEILNRIDRYKEEMLAPGAHRRPVHDVFLRGRRQFPGRVRQ